MKIIYCFLGPSSSGKTTLAKNLKDIGFIELVSCTTRKIRIGEIEGSDYYFLTKEEFNNTELIECVEYSGNYYGLSKKEIDNKLQDNDKIFVILDKQGVLKIKELYGDIVKVIYVYCSEETLKERLLERGKKMNISEEQTLSRIDTITREGELNNISLADYVIINDKNNLEKNINLLKFIVGD